MKIMVSNSITSWQIDGETMETVTDFLDSNMTADGDCSHEIKTLVPWKKSYVQTNLASVAYLLCDLGQVTSLL